MKKCEWCRRKFVDKKRMNKKTECKIYSYTGYESYVGPICTECVKDIRAGD